MSDSKTCLLTHEWDKVQGILKHLPINTPAFELTITKRVDHEFIVQFKDLTVPVEVKKIKKINPVGLHDLFW